MISGIVGEYSPRISKNGDGEGDPLCLSFGDTSGTGIIQNLGWLQGNLWKSPKIPCCCLPLSTRHIYWLQGSRRSKSLEGPLVMDFKYIWGASVEFWVLASPSGAAKEDSVLAVCIAVWTLAVWTVKILWSRHIYWLQGHRRSELLEGQLVITLKNIGGQFLQPCWVLKGWWKHLKTECTKL